MCEEAVAGVSGTKHVEKEEKSILFGCDRIEDYLYLGDLGSVTNFILDDTLDVKHIMTVFEEPIVSVNDRRIDEYHLAKHDSPNEDILSHLNQCIQFIKNHQNSGENVLIQCGTGYSRSATVVIAFIMNKNRQTYREALNFVTERRPLVMPNTGFENQLNIFERMNNVVDVNYKEFRLFMFAHLINYLKPVVRDDDSNLIEVKSGAQFTAALDRYFGRFVEVEMNNAQEIRGREYVCSACHFYLFHEINVIRSENTNASSVCHNRLIFIEPKRWMKQFVDNQRFLNFHGIIVCTNCGEILGEYDLSGVGFSCMCALHNPFSADTADPQDYTAFNENNYKCLAFKIHANRCELKQQIRARRQFCCCCS